MDVFIVRPFGTQEEIDFDRVEKEIIVPAFEEMPEARVGTTGEIAQQGNIRVDMMDRLLTADLVIADISIHNANVYYELGVRHALRHKPTILIRCRAHPIPFDLKTDRYLAYAIDDPKRSARQLKETIEATLKSDVADSPVYQLLPNLESRDGAQYISMPRDFSEAVARARADKDQAKLLLLADEARKERWHLGGERLVGRALFDSNLMSAALVIWERVRSKRPDDEEANLLLGTVFQRLGDRARSDQALDRLLKSDASRADRAEALALRGRNFKDHWKQVWQSEVDLAERQRKALRSDLLLKSLESYHDGYLEDLNAYYPGLNALSMIAIVTELAALHPETWSAKFEDDDRARVDLDRLVRRRAALAGSVERSLAAARKRETRSGQSDPWRCAGVADYRFLTSDRQEYVIQGYADALATVEGFTVDSIAQQLQIYVDLGILSDLSQAALEATGHSGLVASPVKPLTSTSSDERPARRRVIVSTGHRVDAPDREAPRFPAGKESVAREAIAKVVQREREQAGGEMIGLSGIASGNDILFHEVCAELGVETQASLALPEKIFQVESVQESGPLWVERFRQVLARVETEVLELGVPSWVSDADASYAFQRCNMWLLERAFAIADADVTLVALWDGEDGDGPGGTADMVALASERGAKIEHIDTRTLFELT